MMNSDSRTYKYMLRKGSKKDVCPVCGEKRFVPYVLTSDGVTPAGCNEQGQAYGRCDREQECGYFCYPKGEVRMATEPVQQVEVSPLRLAPAIITLGSIDSVLYRWFLKTVAPHTPHGVSETLRAWGEYCVKSLDGQPVFFEIDDKNEIRAAKMIPYKDDGHRDHDAKYPAYFLHRDRRFSAYVSGSDLQQVFFGSHLLSVYPNKKVCVVESEKTALAMSVLTHGNCLWLATGGSQMIKSDERCSMLQGRDVTLYPDEGQFDQWSVIANRYGWHISPIMEKHGNKGDDLLDLTLDLLQVY